MATFLSATQFTDTIESGDSGTVSGIDWGTADNRGAFVVFTRRVDRATTVDSLIVGGVDSFTVLGSDLAFLSTANESVRSCYIPHLTVTGTQDMVIESTPGIGSNGLWEGVVIIVQDADPDMATPTVYTNRGNPGPPSSTVMSLDVTSVTGALVVAAFLSNSADLSYTGSASGAMTERVESVGGGRGRFGGTADGAASVTCTETLTDSSGSGVTDWVAMGISFPLAASSSAGALGGLAGAGFLAGGGGLAGLGGGLAGFVKIGNIYRPKRWLAPRLAPQGA